MYGSSNGEFEWNDQDRAGAQCTPHGEAPPSGQMWLVKHSKVRLESGPAALIRLIDKGPVVGKQPAVSTPRQSFVGAGRLKVG